MERRHFGKRRTNTARVEREREKVEMKKEEPEREMVMNVLSTFEN